MLCVAATAAATYIRFYVCVCVRLPRCALCFLQKVSHETEAMRLSFKRVLVSAGKKTTAAGRSPLCTSPHRACGRQDDREEFQSSNLRLHLRPKPPPDWPLPFQPADLSSCFYFFFLCPLGNKNKQVELLVSMNNTVCSVPLSKTGVFTIWCFCFFVAAMSSDFFFF